MGMTTSNACGGWSPASSPSDDFWCRGDVAWRRSSLLTLPDTRRFVVPRFTFCSLASTGRDIKFDMGRVEGYRNFCNKIWNAANFVFENTEGKDTGVNGEPVELSSVDRWIISALQRVYAAHAPAGQHLPVRTVEGPLNALVKKKKSVHGGVDETGMAACVVEHRSERLTCFFYYVGSSCFK